MLLAIAFLCKLAAADCERAPLARAIVGQGATPMACLIDGQQGLANNPALTPRQGERVVLACRRGEPPG